MDIKIFLIFFTVILNNIGLFFIIKYLKKIKLLISKKILNIKIEKIINLSIFIIIIMIEKYLTYEIVKYKVESNFSLDLLNGNFKFMFNQEENIILSTMEIFINISDSLEIYLGIISILVAIYIYNIGIEDSFKKCILMTSSNGEKILSITFLILLFYYLNVSHVLFCSLILITFIELKRMIQCVSLVNDDTNLKKFFENREYHKIFSKENLIDNLENIYYELKSNIYKSMLENDYINFEKYLYFYKQLLTDKNFIIPNGYSSEKGTFIKNINEEEVGFHETPKSFNNIETSKKIIYNEKIKKIEEKELTEAVILIYSIYKYLIDNPNENLMESVSYLHIELADDCFSKNKLREASSFYKILSMKYKYYEKDDKISILEKGREIFLGFQFYEYNKEFNEDKEIIILSAILDFFMELLKKRKYQEIEVFQEILGTKDGSGETILKLYIRIVLIYFLKKEKDTDSEVKELIKNLKSYFCYDKLSILQKLFEKSKKEKLENKFQLIKYTETEPNIFGMSLGSLNPNCINETILELLNDNHVRFINKDFILNNLDDVEYIVNHLELKNLKILLNELEPEIRLKKALNKSKIQITKEELDNFYKQIAKKEENAFIIFIKKNICKNIKNKFINKNTEWSKDFIGYNEIYENEIILALSENFIINRIKYLDEYLFFDKIKKYIISLNKDEIIKKLNKKEKYIMFLDYKHINLKRNLDIENFCLNKNILSKPLLVSKSSIKEIIFSLPYGYEKLKYTYIEIESLKNNKNEKILNLIKGKTQEEKELIKQGSSVLRINKRIEIIFNDNIEIYEIPKELL